jgi:hypothetical protein
MTERRKPADYLSDRRLEAWLHDRGITRGRTAPYLHYVPCFGTRAHVEKGWTCWCEPYPSAFNRRVAVHRPEQ